MNADKHFDSLREREAGFRLFLREIKEYLKAHAGVLLPFFRRIKQKMDACLADGRDIKGGRKGSDVLGNAVAQILEGNKSPSLICFDVNRTPAIRGILDAIRSRTRQNIIALPVSPLINFNVLRQYDFSGANKAKFSERHDYSGFDMLGYVDSHFARCFDRILGLLGLDSTLNGKTRFLGSIRFAPAWMSIREDKIAPLEIKSEKIKTVFFLSHPKSNVNRREIDSVIELLKQFPEYEVLIKPHTRVEDFSRGESSLNISYTTESSTKLINWADVILFWGTSVAIEGYIKDKTMVCLSYVCGNRNLYAHRGAGYIARCRDDLLEFLVRYKKGRKNIDYNYEGISGLLDKDIIPGGDNVIGNYLDFMAENESDLEN